MERRELLTYLLLLAVLLALSSCSATRRVPQGDYLLAKNKIESDKKTHRKERIMPQDVERFIQLKPNRKFLGTNFYLHMHNLANPDTTRRGFFNRLFRKIGEPPVLLDSMMAERTADYIYNYTVYSGFYNADVSYRVDTTRNRKAKVVYEIEQNQPYRIGKVEYEFRDEFLRPIILEDSANSYLKSGDVLDGNVLSSERTRISDYLKNRGYYAFVLKNIEFIGDSTVGDHLVDVTIRFKQHLDSFDSKGMPVYENNNLYRIKEIYINPDYDPMVAASDPDYYEKMDTVEYFGLNIIQKKGQKPKVRKQILRKSVKLYPNSIYRAADVQEAYNDIIRMGYYKNANIVFEELPEDTTRMSELTYIGDEGSGETTRERQLVCHINCIASKTHSYKIDLEATTSSNFYGINATVGYQNRNLLRGSELFDISIKGGYEFMRTKGLKGSFEIGGATSISFPRFITPFKVDRYNRLVNPRTKVELSINSQRRPKYHRVVSGATWGYSWHSRGKTSYVLRPIDFNVIRMNSVDQDFIDKLDNVYLQNSFKDKLVPGISGAFIYNSRAGFQDFYTNSLYIRINWETAGNLARLIGGAFLDSHYDRKTDKNYYKIFGIQFAQYFRIDASVSNRLMLGSKSNFAYRLHFGIGKAYGNDVSLPYDRQFYAGGSNSMRGWIARTLGPGTSPPLDEYPSQTGNLKLEMNAEIRFPVMGILHGAVFADVGNVWFLNSREFNDNRGVFKFNRFYKQLGFNTGVGFRFDIGMAILRLDWGIKIFNPNRVAGDRWISKFKFSDTVLNFGVGYPF